MSDVEKNGEDLEFEGNVDLMEVEEDNPIDVNKYIHSPDESDIGLDIFKQSDKKPIADIPEKKSTPKKEAEEKDYYDDIYELSFFERVKLLSPTTKRIGLSIIVFILCVAIGFGSFFAILGKKNNALSVSYRYSSKQKDVGTLKSIIKRDVNYAYGVYYPYFKNQNLDKAIDKQNKSIIKTFLKKYKHFKSENEGEGAVLTSDYTTTDFVDYYQVVRNTEYQVPGEEKTDHISTIFYDLKQNKTITAKEFFDGNFKQIISVKIANFLKENTNIDVEEIDKMTDYTKINIDNFSFINDSIYFYINDLSGNTRITHFSIDNTISSHFKISYKTLKENYVNAHKEKSEDKDKSKSSSPLDKYVQEGSFGKKITDGIDPEKKMVALTFDDGPNAENTERILDCLQTYRAVATFFVVGSSLDDNAAVVKRAAQLGCEIGNHTTGHNTLTSVKTKEELSKLIEPLNDRIEKITGSRPTLVRPPEGEGATDDFVKKNIDYPMIMWSVDTKDWATKDVDSSFSVIRGIEESSEVSLDGQIILMHDVYEESAEAAEKIIQYLFENGYQFVTVSDLLQLKGIKIVKGQAYTSAIQNDLLYAYSYKGEKYRNFADGQAVEETTTSAETISYSETVTYGY